MKNMIYKNFKRVLIIAILTIGIIGNTLTAYAYTTEDLRGFSGKPRLRTAQFKEWLINVTNRYSLTKNNSELLSEIGRIEFRVGNSEKYKELLDEQNTIEEEVGELIANGSSSNSILERMNRLEDVTKRANKYKEYSVDLDYNYMGGLYASAEEAYKDVDYYLRAIDSEDYELGLIGTGGKTILGDRWSIYEGFGVNSNNTNENEERAVTNGLKFKVSASSESQVYSQFRGNVARIIEDKYLVKTVVIDHGYGLETEIQGLNEVYVQEGDSVSQYEAIGMVENKILKGNEIFIQDYVELKVRLDNDYINPLLIYGTDGLVQYYTWLNANPGVDVDNKFILSLKDEIVDKNEDSYTDGVMAIEGSGYEKAGTKIDITETFVPDRDDSSFNFGD